MKTRFSILQLVFSIAILAAVLVTGAPAQAAPSQTAAPGPSLAKIIADLNQAAARFRSAQADFVWDQFQSVVREHDIQSGVIYFERRSNETLMAVDIQKVNDKPVPKYLLYDGRELHFYQPAIKQMTIFRPRTDKARVESFLTLGFGGSGTELEANWDVTPQGEEKMNGITVVKLDLKPKAPDVQSLFTHVLIWVDPVKGISLKQVFYEPSGDQRTVTYSGINYNIRLNKEVFRIKTAPGTTVQTR